MVNLTLLIKTYAQTWLIYSTFSLKSPPNLLSIPHLLECRLSTVRTSCSAHRETRGLQVAIFHWLLTIISRTFRAASLHLRTALQQQRLQTLTSKTWARVEGPFLLVGTTMRIPDIKDCVDVWSRYDDYKVEIQHLQQAKISHRS